MPDRPRLENNPCIYIQPVGAQDTCMNVQQKNNVAFKLKELFNEIE